MRVICGSWLVALERQFKSNYEDTHFAERLRLEEAQVAHTDELFERIAPQRVSFGCIMDVLLFRYFL